MARALWCSTAVQGKLKTALLVKANTPVGVLQFIQPCSGAALMHSHHAKVHVQAPCSSAALQGKLKTALLVTGNTLVGVLHFVQPCSESALKHSNDAQDPLHAPCCSSAMQARCKRLCVPKQVHLWVLRASYGPGGSTLMHSDPCHEPCACSLLECCCERQGENSHACHCK